MYAVPRPLTPFVGRAEERSTLVQLLLRPEARLVTLTGTGGVGKTRLALEVLNDLRQAFDNGARFVDLAAVPDEAFVVPTICQTLGIHDTGALLALDVLESVLRDKKMLLTLDNAEHLPNVGPLIARLLSGCPDLTVMVTSRTLLHLSCEHRFPVEPLGTPELPLSSPPQLMEESPAVALFVQRAQQAQPRLRLDASNANAVAAICRRLEGLPLAIELAAVQLRLLSVTQLLQRLDVCLGTLNGGARDRHPRHHTMRQTIAWSYDLLPETDQITFRRLAPFVGGISTESAAAMFLSGEDRQASPLLGSLPGDNRYDASSIFDRISRLVDASMLRVLGDEQTLRFGMFHTVREFALEQLEVSGEAPEIHERFARHFLTLIERLQPRFFDSHESAALDQVEAEYDNIRAALGWAIEHGKSEIALRFARVIWHLWYVRGHLGEGRTWGERILALPSGRCAAFPETRGEVRFAISWIALLQGDHDRAAMLADEALAVSLQDRSPFAAALSTFMRGLVAETQGDIQQAVDRYECAIEMARPLNHPPLVGHSLVHLAMANHALGRSGKARQLLEEALALRRPSGNTVAISLCLTALGKVALESGEKLPARAMFLEALALRSQDGIRLGMVESLRLVASTLRTSPEAPLAIRLLGAADALGDHLGASLSENERVEYSMTLEQLQRKVGQAAFDRLYSEGASMATSRIVSETIELLSQPEDSFSASSSVLSRREVEILRLIAEGCTDRGIAEALFISRRTVTSHVTRILTKLDLPSRAAAASYAVREGLA